MGTNIVRHPRLILKPVGAILHGQAVRRKKESSKTLLL